MRNVLRSGMGRNGSRRRLLSGLSFICLLVPSLAVSSDEPVSGPSPSPIDPTVIPDAPALEWVWTDPGIPLVLLHATPFGEDDKGGSYTAMGGAGSDTLTDRERELLAQARAAVEVSRSAGTLFVSPVVRDVTASDARDALAQKERLRSHPAAGETMKGIGAPTDHAAPMGRAAQAVPGSQAGSPTRLTEAELEKLAAASQGSGLQNLPQDTPPPTEAAGAPHLGEPVQTVQRVQAHDDSVDQPDTPKSPDVATEKKEN
ncbi:MAG: hypothetical protein H6682_16945 [Candidatus Eisenbacteria bacterium]|nr:hypothetical protein [Candidatus Eisenbacteria bacterium]